MLALNNKNTLLELLSLGAVVITPNNRLSASLLHHYFAYCPNKTVKKPQCQPYNTIISTLFDKIKYTNPADEHPQLLNEMQCQHLWRTIIKSTSDITYSEGLLHKVLETWKHCQQWLINPEHPSFSHTPQTRMFQSWWRAVNKKLTQLKAVSTEQIIPHLLNTEQTFFSSPVIWVCFDEFNPQQIQVQTRLTEQGITQYCYDLKDGPVQPQLFAAENNKEEYQQLIQWLHDKIQQKEQRIAIVVPNLAQESRSLQRILTQHFDSSLFNISLGEALNNYPLVAHALTWLHLNIHECLPQDAKLLLTSPYVGGAKPELTQRAQYLQESPLLRQHHFSWERFSQELKGYAPKLAKIVQSITPYPPSASPEEWVTFFMERLNLIGFPGDYGLNSEQYQCYHRFVALLDEFRQLTVITPLLNEQDALAALTQLAQHTIFQAQKNNAPIQISGVLEASGCEFDSLWIAGLTDEALLQKTRLSAFISPQLQRDLVMPHSTAARELQFAKQTLQRLQRGSKNTTVFSYAKLQGDRPNLPCPLITETTEFTPYPSIVNRTLSSQLQHVEESYRVNRLSDEQISGGTSLLSNQAQCPFKAFAEYRLLAKAVPEMTDGLGNKERGILIHKMMELIWQHIGSQEQLARLPQESLDSIIDNAIHLALEPVKNNYPETMEPLLHEIESKRLKRLALASLAWEKQRPEFTITALEQSYTYTLAGLEIKVRVDRLDQVDDKKWVIDYKSTLPVSKPWNEDRPQEPQLLLYSLLDEQINTLLFMQVKTGNILCSGLSETKVAMKGITALKKEDDWVNTRSNWEQQLTLLAEEIQSGHCPPQPINTTTCTQCNFKNLCRITA